MRRFIVILLVFSLFFLWGCSKNESFNMDNIERIIDERIEDADADTIEEESTTNSINTRFNIEKIMEENETSLYAKDIEFDMVNNLDVNFLIQGTAELSNYFNYGFKDIEEEYFCMKIKPQNDTAIGDWYLYSRRINENLYNDLLEKGTVEIVVIAIVPSSYYTKGQTNMGRVIYSYWK